MEIKKELPEIFEEFAGARQNAFLAAKAQKEKKHTINRCLLHLFPDGIGVGHECCCSWFMCNFR